MTVTSDNWLTIRKDNLTDLAEELKDTKISDTTNSQYEDVVTEEGLVITLNNKGKRIAIPKTISQIKTKSRGSTSKTYLSPLNRR